MKKTKLVRTSERGDFKRCQWYWWMHWIEGWSPKRLPTWSWFGTAIHEGLAARYPVGKRRGSLEDMYEAFETALEGERRRMVSQRAEWDEDEMVGAEELGRAMLKGYVLKYGNDTRWKVIHTEHAFQIDVVDKKGRLIAIYCGRWDLLVWDMVDKVFRLVDHKTAKSIGDLGWLTLNDQAGSYLWVVPEVMRALGLFTGGEVIDGIVFNYLRKALPDPRPQNAEGKSLNKNGTVSLRQPSELFRREPTWRAPVERVTQYNRVVAETKQMQAILSGKFEPTKTPTHDCKRCPLFEVCELHEQGDDWEELLRHTFVKRDPYADHREALHEGRVYVVTNIEEDQ
jgi:Zierdtviridae exonuclease